MVWFSENAVHCTCEKCKPIEQYQHELKAILHAWREARKVRPTLRLRILLTQGSRPHNITIIKSTPRSRHYLLRRRADVHACPQADDLSRATRSNEGTLVRLLSDALRRWYAPDPFPGRLTCRSVSRVHEAGVVSLAGICAAIVIPIERLFAERGGGVRLEFKRPNTARVRPSLGHAQALADPEKVAQWWQLVEEPQRNLYISHFMVALVGTPSINC